MLSFSPVGTRIRRNAVTAAEPYSTEQFAKRVEACYQAAIEAHNGALAEPQSIRQYNFL